LHSRNVHDWIGVAHNRAIDDFRTELRRPDLFAGNLCDYVASFSLRSDVLPPHARTLLSPEQRETARQQISKLCTSKISSRHQSTTDNVLAPLQVSPSPLADGLVSSIYSAIEASSTSYDLAARLQPILDGAANLDPVDRDYVNISASVAQNSFEYWEGELTPFTQDVIREYGACASRLFKLPYSTEDAVEICANGPASKANFRRFPIYDASPQLQFVALTAKHCQYERARDALYRIVKTDLDGASAGVLNSLFSQKVVTTGQVIVALGATSSMLEGIRYAFELYRCWPRSKSYDGLQ
jgi:hypothetical protein